MDVADRVHFEQGDAAGYAAAEPADIAACLGATWIGNGVLGTIDLLGGSVRDGGLILIGEPYWVRVPETDDLAQACHARNRDEWLTLPELVSSLLGHGLDLVQMLLASPGRLGRLPRPAVAEPPPMARRGSGRRALAAIASRAGPRASRPPSRPRAPRLGSLCADGPLRTPARSDRTSRSQSSRLPTAPQRPPRTTIRVRLGPYVGRLGFAARSAGLRAFSSSLPCYLT